MKRLVWSVVALVLAYVFIGALLDRVIIPEPEPGPEYYPQQGYTFTSRSEGFHQTIVRREGGLAWVELQLEPRAPGPPEHIHTSFPEYFTVTEGTLSLLVNGENQRLHAGESFKVEAGTKHKPFNETDARVIVRGPLTPAYALPERFTVFLTQAYGFFDESAANGRPPKALLQMSRFSPTYDVWFAEVPLPAQKALYFIIGPTARLLGYRTQYPRFVPRGAAR